jgi:hypothetical protein
MNENSRKKIHQMNLIKEIIETDFFLTDEEAIAKNEIKHAELNVQRKYGADEQLLRFKNFFVYPATLRNPYLTKDKIDLRADKFVSKGNVLEDLFTYRYALFEDLEAIQKQFHYPVEDTNLESFPELSKKSIEEIVNNESQREEIIKLSKKELIFLLNAFYFRPFWVNRLEEFDFKLHIRNNVRMENLFYHLFGKNKIPLFLLNAWTDRKYPCKSIDFINTMCMSIIIARGENFETAIQKFKWNIDKDIYRHLFTVNKKCKKEEGFFQAYVYQKGGGKKDYELIHGFIYLNNYDPLDYDKNVRADEIKCGCNIVPWIINSKQNTWDGIRIILEWFIVQFIENKNFSIDNFSFTEALKSAEEFEDKLNKSEYIPKSILSWEKKDDDWEYIDEDQNKWTINEIVSNEELFSDPTFYKNDIYYYVKKCQLGSLRLFSLKLNDEEKLVLVVDIISGFLVQPMKTRFDYSTNRPIDPPNEKELSIARYWDEQILKKYRFNYYYLDDLVEREVISKSAIGMSNH